MVNVQNMHTDISSKSRRTILLATAKQSIIDSLRYDFQGHDQLVLTTEQGWDACDLMKKYRPYAVIIDEELMGLSGRDVARETYRIYGKTNLPTIILLANKNQTHKKVEDDLPHDWICPHPFSTHKFFSRFWNLVDENQEKQWVHLSPLQSSVLKVTRKNLQKLAKLSSSGEGFDMDLVRECSHVIVEATQSDNLSDVLDLLKHHHNYSFVHALKVSSLLTIYGAAIGLGKSDVQLLTQAGLLHDIGKMRIPHELLEKPAALTDTEWQVMRRHPEESEAIFMQNPDIPIEVRNVAARHHEFIDGSGYPYGLRGAEIDDISAIAAIVDIYSALTDKRSYKKAIPIETSFEIMSEAAGKQFEIGLFSSFRAVILDHNRTSKTDE